MYKILLALLFIVSVQVPAESHSLKEFQDKKTQLYGFKNYKGKVVIKPQFQMVLTPSNTAELLIPVLKDGHWYRMDEKGDLKFEAFFYDNGPDYYEHGLTRFVKDGKVGFHNRSGYIMIEPIYDFASPFNEQGYSKVCLGCRTKQESVGEGADAHQVLEGGAWGMIDLNGKTVVKIEYSSAEEAEAAKNKGN